MDTARGSSKADYSDCGVSIEGLARDTTGAVAAKARRAIDQTRDPAEKAWLSAAADALTAVVGPRNSVVHAHPATSPSGHQTLFRRAAATTAAQRESFEVTEKFLHDVRGLAYEHVRKIGQVRLP